MLGTGIEGLDTKDAMSNLSSCRTIMISLRVLRSSSVQDLGHPEGVHREVWLGLLEGFRKVAGVSSGGEVRVGQGEATGQSRRLVHSSHAVDDAYFRFLMIFAAYLGGWNGGEHVSGRSLLSVLNANSS